MTLVSPSFSLYFSNLQRKPMLSLLECMGFLTGWKSAATKVAADLVYTEDQAVVRLVARLEAPEKSP